MIGVSLQYLYETTLHPVCGNLSGPDHLTIAIFKPRALFPIRSRIKTDQSLSGRRQRAAKS